ncbi:MAG: hypothetical protein KatS3mg068_0289 [Candidatus Sericytochromatia bacterium]|nr:MAG: hypothetical protein KatS3mg068_0289 [Candidatus Sericytochromatia bacterium]
MTNATAGVRLGGSGYSYGEYTLDKAKKPAPYDEESNTSKFLKKDRKPVLKDKEIEIFLFTIKEPIRQVISKLMDIISLYGTDVIDQIDIPLAKLGPLGYTSIYAFQPVSKHPTNENIIKAVVK